MEKASAPVKNRGTNPVPLSTIGVLLFTSVESEYSTENSLLYQVQIRRLKRYSVPMHVVLTYWNSVGFYTTFSFSLQV